MAPAGPGLLPLPPNVPPTFYRGGERLRAFRAQAGHDVPAGPEDWIASVVPRWGGGDAGLSRLADGRLLRDVLGDVRPPLVKLLDAGERLPVHVHPDDAFAAERLAEPNGKAEAWYVLAMGEEPPQVGWTRAVERAELADWVRRQDVAAMRAAMHDVDVAPGDVIYVPPGVPHCIPEGCFILEVQQPADLSVLLEWRGFAAEETAFLGLGPERALDAVTLGRVDPAALVRRAGTPGRDLLPPAAEPYFGLELLEPGRRYPAELRTVVVLDGTGELLGDFGAVTVTAGMTFLLGASAGTVRLRGRATVAAVTGSPTHVAMRLSEPGSVDV